MSVPDSSISVAICDDEILLLPQLSAIIKRYFLQNDLKTEPETFSAASDLISRLYQNTRYDVFFLDIDIPEMNGLSIADRIRDVLPDAAIIFVSAKEDLVYDTFRVQPLAFVRKSRFSSDMARAMDVLLPRLKKPEEPSVSFTDELEHSILLHPNTIIYIEACEKYQRIVTPSGEQLIRCSIQDISDALSPWTFIRIHRSYLVNPRYIYRIDSSQVVLDSGQALPLSRHRKKDVMHQFLTYSRTR